MIIDVYLQIEGNLKMSFQFPLHPSIIITITMMMNVLFFPYFNDTSAQSHLSIIITITMMMNVLLSPTFNDPSAQSHL